MAEPKYRKERAHPARARQKAKFYRALGRRRLAELIRREEELKRRQRGNDKAA